FLISVKIFYLNLIEKNELEILNSNGISNFQIITHLAIITGIIGILLLIFFYSFSSALKEVYLDTKNKFSNSNEYLAVVNDDGLWIKEEIDENLYIIHAEKFDSNKLRLITITEADRYYNNKKTIIAKKANISSKNWQLNDVSILNEDGNKNKFKSYVYNSSFNGEIISNLFSNLNALNIYELHKLSNSYFKIGYSNTDIKIHLNKIYSMPIFYILMTILGFLIINRLKKVKSKFFVVVFGIFVSVVVYYLNYFSGILGNKGALPIYLSVWLPLLILFLVCNIGLVRVNEN
ncbi:LptF/LptG family permease, partial [Candidatus Pelagibacter sp.]|nr:LptF/LptG family permease [Candidatus Pelagibacter sp.]